MLWNLRNAVLVGLLAALAAGGAWWCFQTPKKATFEVEDPDPTRRVERFALADAARRAALHEDWPAARETLAKLAALEERILGEVQPDTQQQRDRLERDASNPTSDARILREAARHYDAGAYREAVAKAAEAHAILPDGPDRAAAALLWGIASLERGEEFDKAKARLEQARTEIRRAFGESHPLEAECLCGLARFEEEKGNFIPAEAGYQEALALTERAHGQVSPPYARLMRRLARMFAAWWIWDAEGASFRALQLRTQTVGERHAEYAESLADLGLVHLNCQRDADAVKVLASAIKLLETGRGNEHPALIEPLCWLGQAHTRRGEYTNARLAYGRALRLAERAHGSRHPAHARVLVHFAWLVGDPEQDTGRARRMLAGVPGVYRSLGCTAHPDYPYALAVEAAMYDHFNSSTAGTNFTRARELYRASLDAYEKMPAGTLLPRYVFTVTRAATMGYWDNYRTQSIEETARLVELATNAIRRQQGSRADELHPFYLWYTSAKVRLHLGRGEANEALATARKGYEAMLARYGADSHAGELFTAENVLYSDLLRHGRPAEAMPHIESGLRRAANLARQLDGQAERSRLAQMINLYFTLSCALTAMVDLRKEATAEQAERLYQHNLNFRGLLATRQAEDRAAFDREEVRPLLASLRQARERLLGHLLTPAGKDRERWADELAKLTEAKEDIEADLSQRCKAFLHNRDWLNLTPGQIQARIPKDAALIDFVQYLRFTAPPRGRVTLVREASMAAFVVRREGMAFVDLGPAAPLRKAVDAWRASINNHPDAGDLGKTGAHLASLTWARLAKHVGDADTVLVAPDGPLCAVPFAALPGTRPGKFLLDELTIGYVPSSRWLVDRAEDRETTGLLAVGDLDYGRTLVKAKRSGLFGDEEWEDLPGTRREIDGVEKLFAANVRGEANLLRGKTTKAELMEAFARKPAHIHFAGHGFFADRQAAELLVGGEEMSDEVEQGLSPLERQVLSRNQQVLSGLVLSGNSDDRSTTLLTAEEVGGLDLRGTRLMVLSACDTGLGHVANNEGALGLHRAFLSAGAGGVVTSLWKVDDDATAALMAEFYRNLWQRKMGRLAALCQAQRALMSDTKFRGHTRAAVRRGPRLKPLPATGPSPSKDEAAHPAFWAAFVLSGRWD